MEQNKIVTYYVIKDLAYIRLSIGNNILTSLS